MWQWCRGKNEGLDERGQRAGKKREMERENDGPSEKSSEGAQAIRRLLSQGVDDGGSQAHFSHSLWRHTREKAAEVVCRRRRLFAGKIKGNLAS